MGIATTQRQDPLATNAALVATLESVRRCPARSDYIELCFSTAEGAWTWCFPRPVESGADCRDGDAVVITTGPYGVQARYSTNGVTGLVMPTAEAMAAILSECRTYIARRLIERGW